MSKSKWFRSSSDSDSDSDNIKHNSDSDSDSDSSSESDQLCKWLKKKDNADNKLNSDNINIASSKIKLEEKIINIKDDIIKFTNESLWEDANKRMTQMCRIIKRYNKMYPEFIEVLNILDLATMSDVQPNNVNYKKILKQYNFLKNEYGYIISIYNNPKDVAAGVAAAEDTEEDILRKKIANIAFEKEKEEYIIDIINNANNYPNILLEATSFYLALLLNKNNIKLIISIFTNLINLINKYNNIEVIDAGQNIKNINCVKLQLILSLSIEKLYNIFIKILQKTIPEDIKYINMLNNEEEILLLSQNIYKYYEQSNNNSKNKNLSIIAMIIMDILYYKTIDTTYQLDKTIDTTYQLDKTIDTTYQLDYYNNFINSYDENDILIKTKSDLYYIYNLTLRREFDQVKKLLKEYTIYDIYTKELSILYNNVLVQYALLAYDNNNVLECFYILNEFFNLGNVHELLAYIPLVDSNTDLLIPFHRHISIKKVKEIYLLCVTMLDVRDEALVKTDRRVPISKLYAQILFKFINQGGVFGEIETVEEKIYKISRYLIDGRWRSAYKQYISMEVARRRPPEDDFIKRQFKLISLGAFILMNSEYYDNMCVSDLVNDFELPTDRIINTMTSLIDQGYLDGELVEDDRYLKLNS